MATAFTATSSTFITDTFSSRNAVTIRNDGAGTLLILIEPNSSATPTVSATNKSYVVLANETFESRVGDVGRYYGIFLTAGTAYVTEVANRLN